MLECLLSPLSRSAYVKAIIKIFITLRRRKERELILPSPRFRVPMREKVLTEDGSIKAIIDEPANPKAELVTCHELEHKV